MNAVVHFYLNNISYRNSGASNSKVGNATQAQVLSGKTFTNASGVGLTGTMTNQGAWTNTPTASTKVKIPAGYHNGSGYVDTSTVYTNGYNAGVTFADGRVNTSSLSYTTGYTEGTSMHVTHGTKTGFVSINEEINVGYKPQYIYMTQTISHGNSSYTYEYIDIILCYSDTKCFLSSYYQDDSHESVYGLHQERDISYYVTLTDTGFISKIQGAYMIVY